MRYFVMVAEELHFGRAAERLGIAQPPLSQQIKALELDLGAPLFFRTKRHVELTPAGVAFREEAQKTLDQAERARHVAKRAARGELGQLVVGFVSSAVYGHFPAIFHRMRSRYPDISLVLHDLSSEEQVEAMRARRLDLGVIRPPVTGTESLALRVIWSEPFVIALPQTHRLAKQKRIALESLSEESFLQVPRRLGPGFYDEMMRVCAQAGFAPKVVQEARSTQTIVSLISGGMGVSIVPGSLQSYQRAGVVYRPLKPPVPKTDLAVIWQPEDSRPALRSFLKIIWEVAGLKEP
jgi:DNA-binding transcriptional LysR family regulator